MDRIGRLSAMPLFLRHQDFWSRLLDPKLHLGSDGKFGELREMSGSHRWGIDTKEVLATELSARQTGLLDVAQSILERGLWTVPTWRMEQAIAGLFEQSLGWTLGRLDPQHGSIGFEVLDSSIDEAFKKALVTARWPVEVTGLVCDEIWSSQSDDIEGSLEERAFLEQILIPVLGFPLLDYLQVQPELVSLGLDPRLFAEQRTDFALNSGRGLKLVIEVDGGQHQEESQSLLDQKRDAALAEAKWTVWRVPTALLGSVEQLRDELSRLLIGSDGKDAWGIADKLTTPRPRELMTCVWGATAAARIHYLLLEAVRVGILPWDDVWQVAIIERDTDIADVALADFIDFFGRLRTLYGHLPLPEIRRVNADSVDDAYFVIDLSVTNPWVAPLDVAGPIGWSRPANRPAPVPRRRFSTRMIVESAPEEDLIESFLRDFLRKPDLREGQFEIINRLLTSMDVIGLLPTGGGKSLTYQLCGLLLGGLTVYVSPLKSLLQDQRDRLIDLGIDLATEISSALNLAGRSQASQQLVSGGTRYLLISPERFLIETFRNQLGQYRAQWGEVSQVVIDECHCVSEWGHDFRPAYLSLSRIVKDRTNRLGVAAPLVALTGTASSVVLADVQRELGVTANEAVIRAKRLDRPEIALRCESLAQRQKHARVRELLGEFMSVPRPATDGVLLFSRFIGGLEGVMALSAEALGVVHRQALRFYCGESPNWKQYAAFWLKKKAKDISDAEVAKLVPTWALAPDSSLRDWDDVKAKVQRDFISGLKGGYQVLIATNAFGMGIDKPSIRQVIHFITPQSPEAYYQEVGRAGRDKRPSEAVLLFSDEDPNVTDKILDPGVGIAEAKAVYDEFTSKNSYQGGDFIRTFYFHQNSFAGPEQESDVMVQLLSAIRGKLNDSYRQVFEYIPDGFVAGTSDRWRRERAIEYAVVRLVILGVVADYTKDYNGKKLELTLQRDWEACRDSPQALSDYLATRFRQYVNRYQVNIESKGETLIRQASTVAEIEEVTALSLANYVYEQIERKRRQASRQMLELARKASVDPEGFREDLMLYLQVSEKFTQDLEGLANDSNPRAWSELLNRIDSRDEIRELHGACQRVLESYPTHPGLLSISALTRLNPSPTEQNRSTEELEAALKYLLERWGMKLAKENGDAIVSYVVKVDETLAACLQSAFANWLIGVGRLDEAAERFFHLKPVRDRWLADLVRRVLHTTDGLEGDRI